MARSGYLYRRSSGIYVVRVCVPKRLQGMVGRTELHVSTGVRDPATAKATAFQVLSQWQQRVLELDRMDILKVVEGSPLLSGDGVIRVVDFAQLLGAEPKALLTEIANSRVGLLCLADGWRAIEIADILDVEWEQDGRFIFNSVEKLGESVLLSGPVLFFDPKLAISGLLKDGECLGEVFFRDSQRKRAAFLHTVTKVGIDALMLRKQDAERIRLALSIAVTPSMLDAAKAPQSPSLPVPAVPVSQPAVAGHKYGAMRVSELLTKFLADKKASWKEDQYDRMSGICDVFVELMDDPALADLDRQTIKDYLWRLQTLPCDLYQSRRRYGVTSLADLIVAAESDGAPLMELTTAHNYVRRLSEMLNWAVTEEYLLRNPATGVGGAGKRDKREQDERGVFDADDLAKIFGVEWFKEGKGKATARGDFHSFQPHYYWLPLLGLYTGGRLNELAQLHVDDIQQYDPGCWYLDFNLDVSDKIDADPKEEHSRRGDKSLKTINSQRVVALHARLVELGLPDYVDALRRNGHVRLFPELRFDLTKGYGRAAGSWFNERFLGKRLNISRDGTKTFHSLRHMFISGLFDAEVPEATVAQIAGHERGQTMSGRRYRKDQVASKLQPYIDRVAYPLPTLAPFDVAAGLKAVTDALSRKDRLKKQQDRKSRVAK
jgi:integrase